MGTRKRSQAGAEAARDNQRPRGDSLPTSAAGKTPCAAPTPSAHPAAHASHASVTALHVSHASATPRTHITHAPVTVAAPLHRASAARHGAPTPVSIGTSPRRTSAPAARQASVRAPETRQPPPATRVAPTGALHVARQPGATAVPTQTQLTPRPGPATDSGRRHFGELRAALDEGWEIVQPIFARPLWSAADDSATAFNFVLHSPHGTRLITVPQGALVERFIRDRHLSVDHAR